MKLYFFKTVFLLLVIAGLGYWAFQIYSENETWEGEVYLDRDDEFTGVEIGEFGSLKSCRESARQKMKELGVRENTGGYECRLNCEFSNKMGTARHCEEIMR